MGDGVGVMLFRVPASMRLTEEGPDEVGEMVELDAFFKGAPCFRKKTFFKNPKPEFDEVTVFQRVICERVLPLFAYR